MKFDLKEDVLSLKVCVLGGYKWIVAKIAAKVKVLSFFCNRNGRWLMQNWSKWKMYASFGTILSKKSMDLATCYLVIGRCKTWTWLGKDLNASIRWCFWKKLVENQPVECIWERKPMTAFGTRSAESWVIAFCRVASPTGL